MAWSGSCIPGGGDRGMDKRERTDCSSRLIRDEHHGVVRHHAAKSGFTSHT